MATLAPAAARAAGRLSAEPKRSPAQLGKEIWIALLALLALAMHFAFRYGSPALQAAADLPLQIALPVGAGPLIFDLARRAWKRQLGSDLLAGLSILTAVLLGQYLVAVIVVLMLAGGSALEGLASRRATAGLDALANRIPVRAHRRQDGGVVEVSPDDVVPGDLLLVLPHEVCPVDGTVADGLGVMDEAYLTGEPFQISKAPGSPVTSGAINGDTALTIRALRRSKDSRYARILQVVQMTGQDRPRVRRIADRLGAWYVPLALGVAGASALGGGGMERFLAVLVVATPCPLLIGVPVAIVGGIALAARRGIIIRKPDLLEQIGACTTLILDKTGTLTYGVPTLTEVIAARGFDELRVLAMAASLERYSRHPLAAPMVAAAERRGLPAPPVEEISETPGQGLRGRVDGHWVWITGRSKLSEPAPALPPPAGGLECLIFVDNRYAACLRFRDTPRPESYSFVGHLRPRHGFRRIALLSGDRESEVRYLAASVGVTEIHAGQSPEEKVAVVRAAAAAAGTIFVGDGLNDAPALLAATVGMALGTKSDLSVETADAVVLEPSLRKVDELVHIARRTRGILFASVAGGMALSLVGMGFAAAGLLAPVAGAVAQELIDLLAILNSSRAALPLRSLSDF